MVAALPGIVVARLCDGDVLVVVLGGGDGGVQGVVLLQHAGDMAVLGGGHCRVHRYLLLVVTVGGGGDGVVDGHLLGVGEVVGGGVQLRHGVSHVQGTQKLMGGDTCGGDGCGDLAGCGERGCHIVGPQVRGGVEL